MTDKNFLLTEEDIFFNKNYMSFLNKEKNIVLLNNEEYYISSQFAYYLAGLIEGDGSIIVPTSLKNTKGVYVYPYIKITFAEKDLPLALKLNSVLKLGRIYKEKGKYINLVFYKLDVIFLTIQLIQGKMRTPKIEALNRLIDWFNIRNNIKIEKKGIDISNIGSNSWLAGFLDTDGYFYSHFNLNKKKIAINIASYMRLSQRQVYSVKNSQLNLDKNEFSYYRIMNEIKIFLNVSNLRIINRIRKNDFVELGYEVRTSKIKSNNILISYLDKYPLFSSKYLDYLNWKNIYDIKINKIYKLEEGTNLLITLKSSMNKNRVSFDWKHLDNLWKI